MITITPNPFLPPASKTVTNQIWDRLPGLYSFTRDSHHDIYANGDWCTQSEIQIPSRGRTEIRPRKPANPSYASELLITSVFDLTTNDYAFKCLETLVFRRTNDGDWSLWGTDGDELATGEKICDLRIELERGLRGSSVVPLTLAKYPEEKDPNALRTWYLGLQFFDKGVGEFSWTIRHMMGREKGRSTTQDTRYEKQSWEEEEGWVERMTKGVKVWVMGFLGR